MLTRLGKVGKVVGPRALKTAAPEALKSVAPYVPVIGTAFGFTKTCVAVYKSSSPTGAVVAGVKGLIIDCSPPVIKYPLLCATALACGGAACVTGDPNFVVGAVECCTAIVKDD